MRNIQNHFAQPPLIFGALIAICISILLPVQAQCPATPNIFQTSLLEPPQPGKELSTQQLQQILADGQIPVLDVRFELEYAISHIPSAVNIPPLTSRSAQALLRGGMLTALGMCDIAYCSSKRTSTTGIWLLSQIS